MPSKQSLGRAVLGLALLAGPVAAEDAPWGFQQTPPPVEPAVQSGPDLLLSAYDAMVAAYRENGDQNSIHRCAFGVSCSHFADRALHRFGVVPGLVVFADRYFFRENQATRFNYSLVELDDGTFRSDDAYFVP